MQKALKDAWPLLEPKEETLPKHLVDVRSQLRGMEFVFPGHLLSAEHLS